MNTDLLFRRLKKLYPESATVEPHDPFEVLIHTIISQRTRDEQTREAAERLMSRFPTVEDLAKARVRDIERAIKNAGFYQVKARKIKEVCNLLLEEHDGEVPDDFDKLMELPSVGRKTANCVLVFGFGKPAIPVDTHVHRISNRLGLVSTSTPEHTEIELKEVLPVKYWLSINHMFVRFGQNVCRPIGPKCKICPITELCHWFAQNIE